MNINEVAKQLNELSVKHNFKIADLQKIRFEKYGSVHTYKIFSAKSADPKHDYAFHSGGRKELKFNIGEEDPNIDLWSI